MKNQKKHLKPLALSLALAVGLLWPMAVNAQNYVLYDDGLFSRGPKVKSYNDHSFFRGVTGDNTVGYLIHNQQFGSDQNGGYNLYNQSFEEVPMGSGLLILTAAGAGYALKKRKSNKNSRTLNTHIS